jgi:hypothetical protein
MRLFDGLGRTDYQDLLRALGHELDAEGACDLRLIEREDGLMVQLRYLADLAAGFEAYHLSDDDLRALLQSAYARRGSGRQPARDGDYQGIHYQELLRAIGRVLDAEGLRDLRLIEQPAAVVLQVTRGGRLMRGFQTYRLTVERLQLLLQATSGPRATSTFGTALP